VGAEQHKVNLLLERQLLQRGRHVILNQQADLSRLGEA
jgi:hypothetical protein